MINGKSVLALITARGGSKGLPGKNIRDLGGKPLIAWTIETARRSRYVDRLILSSEDEKIIEKAKKLGCEVPFVRPSHLSKDGSTTIDVIKHALSTLPERYDYLVLLQPTSPLRLPEDIDNCLELCHDQKAPAAVSVTEVDQNPGWMYKVGKDHRMTAVIPDEPRVSRRQELPQIYILNGAVFIARVDWISKEADFLSPETVAYLMPMNRSVDIDTEIDLDWANFLLGK